MTRAGEDRAGAPPTAAMAKSRDKDRSRPEEEAIPHILVEGRSLSAFVPSTHKQHSPAQRSCPRVLS